MDDIITVAYSDASLFKPRKIDDLVPVAGYVSSATGTCRRDPADGHSSLPKLLAAGLPAPILLGRPISSKRSM